MPRPKSDPKADTLREQGCLHPHPEKVTDEAFVASAFFDRRDLVQVKYEMLRRVRVDGQPVSQSAAGFGLSRPTYYQAQAAYEAGGLPALLPKKPGPRRAHKLSEEVVTALREALAELAEEAGDTPYPGWDALRDERLEDAPAVLLTVRDSSGDVVRTVTGPPAKGIQRVAWDLSYPRVDAVRGAQPRGRGGDDDGAFRGTGGVAGRARGANCRQHRIRGLATE